MNFVELQSQVWQTFMSFFKWLPIHNSFTNMLWLCSATLSKTVDHSAALHAAASCSHVLIDPVIVTWTATQSFKGGGHCACQRCESLYSICIPSVKLVGLPVLRIWQIFSHSVNWPGNLDLWPCDRSVNEVTGHLWYGLPANFSFLRHSVLDLEWDMWQTDRQTMAIST